MAMRTKQKALEIRRDPRRVCKVDKCYDNLEALVRRFDVSRRSAIRKLVYSSSRLADLAVVFPGAIFALASRRGPRVRRLQATDLVERGAALKEVAAALDIPLWMRRLPPEAFAGTVGPMPASELFTRRIASRLPSTATESAFWLQSVSFASSAADDYFALWLAAQPIFFDPGEPERLFGLLAAYAWHSNAEQSPAHALIGVPWRPEMALDTAICAAKSWLNRIRLVLQLREGSITDTWLEPGQVNALTFRPLNEQSEILAEARVMQNCADQYADRIARDKCRLFSVRRRGVRVATLEVGPHHRESGILTIVQLKARHNVPAPIEVWQAAHTWLGQQNHLKRPSPPSVPDRPLDAVAWTNLMTPYRTSKQGAACWMPQPPTRASFAALEADIAELARRAGITSWLFT
jgi:hypothetical protein